MTIEEQHGVKVLEEVSHCTCETYYLTAYRTNIDGLYVYDKVGRSKRGEPTQHYRREYSYLGRVYSNLEDALKIINHGKKKL